MSYMPRNSNSSTEAQNESNTSNVYAPGMPSLAVVETVASKLFHRRGSLESVSRDE
jgi:hypothetical protein